MVYKGIIYIGQMPFTQLREPAIASPDDTCCESMNFRDLLTPGWQITFHQNIEFYQKKVNPLRLASNRSSINFIAFNYSLRIARYHIFASRTRTGSLDFDSFLLRLKDKLCITRTCRGYEIGNRHQPSPL